MRNHLRLILLLLLGQFFLSGCAAHQRIADRVWHEVRTPHFVIISDMSQAKASKIAQDLERFRAVVEFVTGQKIPPAPVPTYVYAFQKQWEYQRFSYSGLAGYFTPGVRSNRIVFGPSVGTGIPQRQVVQHEYVHFLLSNHGKLTYPKCYNEGFAEFLGTAWIRSNRIDIGRAPGRRLTSWVPLGDLLEPKASQGFGSSEYFQCWGLVHYLSFGRPDASANLKQLTVYLRAREAGLSVAEAVPKAFGTSLEDLDESVKGYMEAGEFRYVTTEASRFDVEVNHSSRLMSADEISVFLGDLLIQVEAADEAEIYYRNAVEINADNSRAWAGLGVALTMQREFDGSDAHFQRALELDALDPRNHLDYGGRFLAAATHSDSDTERATLAREARAHYTRAWELDDSRPEAYTRYGSTFLLEGQDPELGREPLEHADRLLPGDQEIQVALAHVYLKLDEKSKARSMLLRSLAESHEKSLPDWAKEFLDEAPAD